MEVIHEDAGNKQLNEPYACALGFFDGIHIGHQNLIAALKNASQYKKLKSMVFTFDKHPMTLLDPYNSPKLIMDNETKINVFSQYGIDTLYFCKLDNDLLCTEPEVFLNEILLKKLNIKAVIAGFNFRFGFKGRGDSNTLIAFNKKSGIDISVVEPVYYYGELVSSTAVREYLNNGNIEMVNKFIGRNYYMHGKVTHGMKRGRNLGFPTANIYIGRELITPKNGVYITKVVIDNDGINRIGITNIGCNPTFGNSQVSVETHILDYDKDIYDKHIELYFFKRLRDEIKFTNLSELSFQIHTDKAAAVQYFE